MGTIQVRRANVILDVPDYQQAEYLAKGFDVIGADGKVLVKTTPNDLNALKKAYTDLLAEVEALRKENTELKKQLDSKSKKVEDVEEKKEEMAEEPETPEEVEEEEIPEEPKKAFTPINKRGSKKQK